MEIKSAILKTLEFCKLECNWNEYEGMPIPTSVILNVIGILSLVGIECDTSPTGRGTVDIEYTIEGSCDITLEVGDVDVVMDGTVLTTEFENARLTIHDAIQLIKSLN
jgi:hypothetical protein